MGKLKDDPNVSRLLSLMLQNRIDFSQSYVRVSRRDRNNGGVLVPDLPENQVPAPGYFWRYN
mgnify:CR=1 FL=1